MKDTIDMAREVKMPYDFVTGEPIYLEKLKAFEALVRADEIEACAKVCEQMLWVSGQSLPSNHEMSAAIRARGNT
jgi:hypothetical protein